MPPPMPKIAQTIASAAGDAGGREGVADDPEREREDTAGHALQQAPGDHDLDRAGASALMTAPTEKSTSTAVSIRPLP